MKYSIVVPVYNTEKYLKRCIDSVLNQTYKNFEIIIINDGSKDNSKEILNEYKNNKQIKIINQENHGLSYSRNVGIKEASGDYILFLDSDDFYQIELLETLNKNITNEEIIKFGFMDFKNSTQTPNKTIKFKNYKGIFALKHLIESRTIFEMAWMYAFKKDYMQKYEFTVNRYHEDFGLIPIMINNSNRVSSIDYLGYNYNRDNETSITAYTDNEKEFKKACDTLYFFKEAKTKETNTYLLSFYANGCLNRVKKLQGENKKKYLKELKKEKVYNYLLNNTLKRKIKKLIIKIYLKLK